MKLLTAYKSFFIPLLFCIGFFLWSDSLIDPAMTLRVTYFALVLLGINLYTSFSKKSFIDLSILPSSYILSFLTGYIFLTIMSGYQSINIQLTLFEFTKLFLLFILILALCAHMSTDPFSFIYKAATLLTITSAIFLVIGYVELFQQTEFFTKSLFRNPMAYATFGNRNIFAEVMLLILPAQAITLYKFYNAKLKYYLVTSILLTVLLIVLSESRTCWLALALSTPIVSVFLLPYLNIKDRVRALKKKNKIWITAACIILAVSLIPLSKNILERVNETISNLTHTNIDTPQGMNSITERAVWWHKTFEMIKDHPLTGVGPGNWKIRLPEYDLSHTRAEVGLTYFLQPHNDYLWIWAESGIFCLLFYLLFFSALIFTTIRIIRKSSFDLSGKLIAGACLYALICFLVISFFSFPKDRMEYLILLGFYTAIVVSIYRMKMQNANAHNSDPKPIKITLTIISLLLLSGIVLVGYKNIRGQYYSQKAEVDRLNSDFQQTISDATRAKNIFYNCTPQGIPVDYLAGMAHYHLGNGDLAISSFESALKYNPNHILTLHFIGVCYGMKGDEATAISYFERALKISDRVDLTKVNLAVSYYNTGQYEKAYNTIRKLREEKSVKENLQNIKLILFKAGKIDQAQASILTENDIVKNYLTVEQTDPD